MNEFTYTTLFLILGTLVTLYILIYMIRKKREHEDFAISVTILGALFVALSYASYYSILDTIDLNKENIATINGTCEIVFLENIGGRFGEYNLIQVNVDNISVEAEMGKFPELEEGIFQCEINYLENTQTLLNINLK
ncbi:hypothetical protein MKZ17_07390 [Solibacillus sp. FSL R7-0682]|uniref:hypothetical protein n=1 Tax=Solibacillus sp. FSL R7-0682 TaxID=2921690 RepID=UPI0030F983F7